MKEINVNGKQRNEREQTEKEDKEDKKDKADKKDNEEAYKENGEEKEDKEDKENKEEKNVGIQNNKAEEVDTINDDNIICLCLRNILTSTSEKDSEHFWTEKNAELKTFTAKNTKSKEFENEKWDDEVIPTNIMLNSWNEVHVKNETVNIMPEEQNPFLKSELESGEEETEGEIEKETEEDIEMGKKKDKPKGKEKQKQKGKKKIQRRNRKRKYIDIEKVHFDFDDEDFATNEDEKFVNVNSFNGYEEPVSEILKWDNVTTNNNYCNINWDDWINMEDESVKTIITPPKIPLNETFRRINKEISELYIKSTKETKNKQQMNIFLSAQLKCLETIEAIEREHSSISEHFDKAIMEKLQITESNGMDSTNASNKQNENLTKLLEYLMSWYFAGFYIGRMSSQKL